MQGVLGHVFLRHYVSLSLFVRLSFDQMLIAQWVIFKGKMRISFSEIFCKKPKVALLYFKVKCGFFDFARVGSRVF